MLGESGFNELDLSLFKHLIHNKKPCCFVRTKCDSEINGILDQSEVECPITPELAFEKLQADFRLYMKQEVMSQTNFEGELGLFLFGKQYFHTIRSYFRNLVKIFILLDLLVQCRGTNFKIST